MKSLLIPVVVALAALLGGCASPPSVLKVTTTGGDALPRVTVSPTGQPDMSSVNVGDTVVFAPGSMRSVVAAPQVKVTLFEPGSVTEAENKKQLSVNRREGAKIEVMKGRLINGDFFQTSIPIDLSNSDPKRLDIDLLLLAFNRGEKDFRGDLTVYDLLPPELQLTAVEPAAKYNDRRGVKGALSAIPLLNLISMGMDNFSRSSELLTMDQERLGQVSKYTFRRLVLEPGQAVGFTVKLRYQLPAADELNELRLDSRPMVPGSL